jgi:queuosine precursor transporter
VQRCNHTLPPPLAVLVALYLGAIVSANAVAAKLFVVAGDVHITSGALAIPVVFLTTDLINELYGPRVARAVVWMGLLANLALVAAIAAAGAVPSSPLGVPPEAFDRVFDLTWRVVVGSSLAYLVSSLLDVRIFHLIKEWTGPRYFWMRKNGSTIVSQMVDTFIFIAIAFGGTMDFLSLMSMGIGQYVVKIAMAPLGTPLSYLILRIAKRTQ